MKTFSGKNINLSHISNIKDLNAEIAGTELRLRQNKTAIKSRFKRVPAEATRSVLGTTFPFFKKEKKSDAVYHVLQTLAVGIVAAAINAKRGKKTFKQGLMDTVRQISFLEMAAVVAYLLRRKKV